MNGAFSSLRCENVGPASSECRMFKHLGLDWQELKMRKINITILGWFERWLSACIIEQELSQNMTSAIDFLGCESHFKQVNLNRQVSWGELDAMLVVVISLKTLGGGTLSVPSNNIINMKMIIKEHEDEVDDEKDADSRYEHQLIILKRVSDNATISASKSYNCSPQR